MKASKKSFFGTNLENLQAAMIINSEPGKFLILNSEFKFDCNLYGFNLYATVPGTILIKVCLILFSFLKFWVIKEFFF